MGVLKDFISKLMTMPDFKEGRVQKAMMLLLVSDFFLRVKEKDFWKNLKHEDGVFFNLVYLHYLMYLAKPSKMKNEFEMNVFKYPNNHIKSIGLFIKGLIADPNFKWDALSSVTLNNLMKFLSEFPEGIYPEIEHDVVCSECNGSGTVTSFNMTCQICEGSGIVSQYVECGQPFDIEDMFELENSLISQYSIYMKLLEDFSTYFIIGKMYEYAHSNGDMGSICNDNSDYEDYAFTTESGVFMMPGKLPGMVDSPICKLSFKYNGEEISFVATVLNKDKIHTPEPPAHGTNTPPEDDGYVRRFISAPELSPEQMNDVSGDELYTYTKKNGDKVIGFNQPPTKPYFECFNKESKGVVYFDANIYNRDEVRQATAGILKIKKEFVGVEVTR